MKVLNESQRELLYRLMRAGGSATSAELGGRRLGVEWSRHFGARQKCRIEGLVTYDRPGKVGGRWHITDAGRREIHWMFCNSLDVWRGVK